MSADVFVLIRPSFETYSVVGVFPTLDEAKGWADIEANEWDDEWVRYGDEWSSAEYAIHEVPFRGGGAS